MDELSLYFSTENETSKTKLGRKSAKSFSRPNNFHNDSHQSKVFRDYRRKNKSMEFNKEVNHRPLNNIITASNTNLRNGFDCGNISTNMPHILPPEVEVGNVEYKRKLVDPTPNRFEQLVTQMKWRLNEGGGKAIYKLGVDDDGHISGLCQSELVSSLATLERMAKRLNATLHPLRERIIEPIADDGDNNTTNPINREYRKAIELLVRLAPTTNDGSPDLCVALVGGMDSGKSTLIGVLTDGELDNARGKARLNLFRHLHEVQSGRTSSLSRELLGFDADGNVTNYKYADGRVYRRSAEEVVRMSSNLITLIDLAGHSRYQRTTLSGIACNQPVMSILVISATIGLTTIGLEHIQLIRSLNLPMIVVLTKIDQLASGGEQQLKRINSIYRQLVYQFKQIEYAWSYNNGIPIWNEKYSMFNNSWELNSNKDSNGSHCMPPFFPVSSVTGQGIDHLIKFLSRLSCLNQSIDRELTLKQQDKQLTSSNQSLNNTIGHVVVKQAQSLNSSDIFYLSSNENQIQLMLNKINEEIKIIKTYRDFNGTLFWINQVYTQIPGVCNPVLVGRVQLGQLLNNQILWLGPDHFGDFYPVQIVSLMHNRQVHEIVYAGQLASMEVHFLPKSWNNLSYSQRIHILQNISSSYNNNNNNTNGIMNQQNKRSQYLLFGNDNDNTGNEENIPYNEQPDDSNTNTSQMWHSSVKLRRGMILLTYPMLMMNKHLSKSSSLLLLSSTNLNSPSTSSNLSPLSLSSSSSCSSTSSPSSPLPSLYDAFIWNQPLKSKDCINFSVVWTVKLRLACRLPIVSFKLGTPPIILTPIPSIGQRVTIYAGCICQTGVIIDGRIEENQRSEYDQCGNNNNNLNNKNHLEDTSHLYVRFTRQPECVEIGRQFILTWNGSLKTVGYVIDLIDPLKCNSSISLLLNNETSNNNNDNKGDAIQSMNDSDNDFIWKRHNTLSFREKDDYDSSWSSLRMNFIDRMMMNTTHDSGNININNNNNNLQYFYHKSKSLSLSLEEFDGSNYASTNEKFDSMHYTTSIHHHLSSLLEAEIENQENQKKGTDLSSGGDVGGVGDVIPPGQSQRQEQKQQRNEQQSPDIGVKSSQSTNYPYHNNNNKSSSSSSRSNKRRHRRKQKS